MIKSMSWLALLQKLMRLQKKLVMDLGLAENPNHQRRSLLNWRILMKVKSQRQRKSSKGQLSHRKVGRRKQKWRVMTTRLLQWQILKECKIYFCEGSSPLEIMRLRLLKLQKWEIKVEPICLQNSWAVFLPPSLQIRDSAHLASLQVQVAPATHLLLRLQMGPTTHLSISLHAGLMTHATSLQVQVAPATHLLLIRLQMGPTMHLSIMVPTTRAASLQVQVAPASHLLLIRLQMEPTAHLSISLHTGPRTRTTSLQVQVAPASHLLLIRF